MKQRHYVFLNGWAFTNDIWDRLLSQLHMSPDVVTMLDWTDIERSEDIDDRAFQTVRSLERRGKTVLVIGWSLGTLVAQKLAAAFPQTIERLVLFAPVVSFVKRRSEVALWDGRVLQRMKSELVENPIDVLHQFAKLLLSKSDRTLGFRTSDLSLAGDTRGLVAGLTYLEETYVKQELERIEQPILIIHGARDRVCSVQAGARIRDLACGRVDVVICKNTGHLPCLTLEQDIIEQISRFLMWEKIVC